MDPLQWMGAVRMSPNSWLKHHNNPHHSNPSINILWRQKLCVCKKTNASWRHFLTKYKSIVHNIAFSSEKVVSSESGEKSAQIQHRFQAKTVQNSYKQICGWILMEDRFYGLWTLCILAGSNGVKLKTSWWICFLQTRSFWLHKMLIDGLEWCGLLWCFYQLMFLMFLSNLILTAPIHCRWSIGEQVIEWHISPNLMKKQTHLHLGWPWGNDIISKFSFLVELFL